MNQQRPEVRQCPSCQQVAVLLVNEWQHTGSFGATGEVTRDYRCQQCGAWFVRRSSTRAIGLWVAGVLLLPACGLGLPFIWVAWQNGRFEERVRLVRDAPVPALRFPGGPPKRVHAGCGGVAHATQITRHTNRGIPTGTEYTYQCATCQAEFTTESWLGHVTSTLLSLVCVGVTLAFLLGADSPGWKYGGTAVMAVVTALVSWNGLSSFVNRFRHREVAAPPVVNELR